MARPAHVPRLCTKRKTRRMAQRKTQASAKTGGTRRRGEMFAVIMAGGSGDRFWPFSTPENPKQFLSVFGGKSLLRQTADRLRGLVPPERIFVVTTADLAEKTRRELPETPRANIVGEPCRRDTAAAMAAACGLVLRAGGPESTGIVLSADHVIADAAGFRRALRACARAAMRGGTVVTVGTRPDRPATEYGYIETEKAPDFAAKEPAEAKRFAEKPDAATAARWIATGRFLWNSGTFVWKAGALKEIYAKHAARWLPVIEALESGRNPSAALKATYPDLPKTSFDYAVMEKTGGVRVMPADVGWDDVGSWLAIERAMPQDAHGNTVYGVAAVEDCSGCVAAGEGPAICAIGLKDVVVAATPQGVLVAAKKSLAGMKTALAALRRKEAR